MRCADLLRVSRGHFLLATAALALGLAGEAPAAAQDESYGFYRVVEGSVNLTQEGSTDAVVENHPLLTGDRLWTARGSRAEVVLPDGTVVRVGGEGELTFETLATSGDTSADSTLLLLQRGELQVVTDATSGVDAYPRIDTDDATVYLEGAGSYLVEAEGGATLVVVRRGSAEVTSRRGSIRLAEGQEAWVQGEERPQARAARGWSTLERWGGTLDDQVRQASHDDSVDGRLRYGASRMDGHGSWVQVESRRAWRPRVGADWSPYRHGRWTYTPSGQTWVSYEPWGWVPYHYGSWDFVPGWGWVWYPGRVYAPAWVYWYWGPRQVGWCPIGYYYRHYRSRYYSHYGWDVTHGFRFGIHGWAGGSIRHWDRWSFVDCDRFNDRRVAYYTRSGSQLGHGLRELPRGVISTDTRGIRRAVASRPGEAMRVLTGDRPGSAVRRELPDLTRFVARDPDVPAEVARVALPIDPTGRWAVSGRPRETAVVPGESPRAAKPDGTGVESPRISPRVPARIRPRGEGEGETGGGAPRVRSATPPAGVSGGEAPAVKPRRPHEGAPPPAVVRPPNAIGGEKPREVVRVRPPAERGESPDASAGGGVRRVTPGRVTPGRETPSDAERPAVRPRTSPPAGSPPGESGSSAREAPPVRRASPPGTLPRRPGNEETPQVRQSPDGGSPRAVPPVRRVVEGVRRPDGGGSVRSTTPPPRTQSAPSGDSGSYEPRRPAPAPRGDDGGSVRSRGSSGEQGGSSARSSGSRGDRGGGGESSGSRSQGSNRGGARTRSQSSDPDRR